MKKAILIIPFFIFFGCKNIEEIEKINLTINLKISNDGIIQIFYADHPLEIFTQKKSISQHMIGSDEYQKIQFEFKNSSALAKIRIDLGDRINNVEIASIIITKGNNNITIKKDKIIKFLKPNKNIEISKYGDIILRNDQNINYDPYFTSTPLLIKEILNL